MSISIIAAVGKNFELGKNNDLIWHFKEDMKFFRETTTGNTVLMGRKTFESLPKLIKRNTSDIISLIFIFAIMGLVVICIAGMTATRIYNKKHKAGEVSENLDEQ